jgi:hypothetical protein
MITHSDGENVKRSEFFRIASSAETDLCRNSASKPGNGIEEGWDWSKNTVLGTQTLLCPGSDRTPDVPMLPDSMTADQAIEYSQRYISVTDRFFKSSKKLLVCEVYAPQDSWIDSSIEKIVLTIILWLYLKIEVRVRFPFVFTRS